MVELATRLGVPLEDVVYVSSKNSSAGGVDDKGYAFVRHGAERSPRVAAWLDTYEWDRDEMGLWREATRRVAEAARASATRLADYRAMLRLVAPCAADARNFQRTECYWNDNGCAHRCIDSALRFSRPPAAARPLARPSA